MLMLIREMTSGIILFGQMRHLSYLDIDEEVTGYGERAMKEL